TEVEVVAEPPKKAKKRSIGVKTHASLEHIMPEGSHLAVSTVDLLSPETEGFLDSSAPLNLRDNSGAATTTEPRADAGLDLASPSRREESKGSNGSFYDPSTLNRSDAKRWYVPKWNITNDALLDEAFACRTLICLRSEVRSRAEHELELKEKLKAKYDVRGKLLEEKDLEILRLKSQLAEKEVEAAEAVRLRDQVFSLSGEKSALTAEVSALKVTISQKDHDISLLDSRATHLTSTMDDAKTVCTEVGIKITSLASERGRLASKVFALHAGFQVFKEKIETQQEEQAQELYNRVAELEAYMMDVSGHLEGEFYPTYLTLLAGRRWLLTHGIYLALLKCLKSSEYQGILGHALGRAIDFGMQEGLEAGHEHAVARRSLAAVDAYNPKVAKAKYVDAVQALEDVSFPLVDLLKSKKDAGIEQLITQGLLLCSHALSNFRFLSIIPVRIEPLTWMGEASTFVGPLSIEDYDAEDTDEILGCVVAIPELEPCRFVI
ncbi:hypothetical protein Tco_1269219, partial [Tanacetum coccineum]